MADSRIAKRRQMTSAEIRTDFLAFFREKEHTIVRSASLVPRDDPSLLFINAGMNQFKGVFLGTSTREYLRAADSQKCLRVSGKHNDLEEVGHDTYHHTFFEMLGNWSFGDYFKDEAIAWAWELLTERWSLDESRLYATVHEGDESMGLGPDEEAAEFWRRHLPDSHVLYCSTKDNFWMMGETGPCGPCSEIHIDLRSDEARAQISGQDLVNKDHPEVIELWNLVFIQFNAGAGGALERLAAQHVDTGMGLERLTAAVQGAASTYDTDLFVPLMARIAELSPIASIRGYDDLPDVLTRQQVRVALRVVADHIRAIAFAIADGVAPGNVGRAYVIRRILRRAARYGYTTLGFREPFLYKLVEPLVALMGAHYDELVVHRDRIEKTIRGEEAAFLRTLGNGIALFELIVPYVLDIAASRPEDRQVASRAMAANARAADLLQKAYPTIKDKAARVSRLAQVAAHKQLPGEVVFLLHDTYGFPLDLTQLMARERGLGIDKARYNALMTAQIERARKDLHTRSVSVPTKADKVAWQVISGGLDSQFCGYDSLEVTGLAVRALHIVEPYVVVLDASPFYAEQGGQMGDTGTLQIGGEVLRVLDTQHSNGQVHHIVDRLPEEAHSAVHATVDAARRSRISKHHTATHLLHAALREVLGPGVAQKGSLVAPGHLRFDFNHYQKVRADELQRVQEIVNCVIQRNVRAEIESDVPIAEALARGARALFGEKYGSLVRVVVFDESFSVELCGGTHVGATGEIGFMLLQSEGSVAAGIRRVEAIAGLDAVTVVQDEISELRRVRGQFKGKQGAPNESIAMLQEENRVLHKEVLRLRNERLAASLDGFAKAAVRIGGGRVAASRIADTDMATLRKMGEELRRRLGAGGIGVLGTQDPKGDKAYLVATVADDLVASGIRAGTIVGQLARCMGGDGGGRPQLATAGGRRPEKLDEALAAVPEIVRAALDGAQ